MNSWRLGTRGSGWAVALGTALLAVLLGPRAIIRSEPPLIAPAPPKTPPVLNPTPPPPEPQTEPAATPQNLAAIPTTQAHDAADNNPPADLSDLPLIQLPDGTTVYDSTARQTPVESTTPSAVVSNPHPASQISQISSSSPTISPAPPSKVEGWGIGDHHTLARFATPHLEPPPLNPTPSQRPTPQTSRPLHGSKSDPPRHPSKPTPQANLSPQPPTAYQALSQTRDHGTPTILICWSERRPQSRQVKDELIRHLDDFRQRGCHLAQLEETRHTELLDSLGVRDYPILIAYRRDDTTGQIELAGVRRSGFQTQELLKWAADLGNSRAATGSGADRPTTPTIAQGDGPRIISTPEGQALLLPSQASTQWLPPAPGRRWAVLVTLPDSAVNADSAKADPSTQPVSFGTPLALAIDSSRRMGGGYAPNHLVTPNPKRPTPSTLNASTKRNAIDPSNWMRSLRRMLTPSDSLLASPPR
ncbi:hypothetical protein Isop_1462 [Isosphaera pallida ATCC 43644]|uniref:Thioredoxin domain-containing protein n=1 Tax=Isosphaera pallida (strain ATCC 43644 / DSM 9630 / IS1B) TaxID=575540 RepID=E8QY57_ISOPI|nr:hypothetical protein [Isosphaera pallida]ADV62047.1 hypothetical protein Isop_1462 [Isosphaera pallida ATCC 43644]